MHSVTSTECLLVEVVLAEEPAAALPSLWSTLRPLFEALGDEPKTISVVSPGGRLGRERAFSWKTLSTVGADENVGTIFSGELRNDPADLKIHLYLRHNPKLPVDAQPPASEWLAVGLHRERFFPDRLPTAAAVWIADVAEHFPALHGGVTMLGNVAQAEIEASGSRDDLAQQPFQFQQRREHDWWRNKDEIRRKCRRLYWTTLLGPALTAAAGGAEAARAAGALNVREINGSIVFQAMEGPPRDSLDPEFLAATTKLRRWLWPHTFQNPLDAAGFEAEVGLVAPT